ncbi:Retrotransposon-like protein [Zea mays]|uniref:Retrotransposon-like protein n=1 Tax=Zea mays TaxID=4577 RepID=A0A1D6GVV5_MAIZE|nr:Retrotransposon-like protein [Zea mays]
MAIVGEFLFQRITASHLANPLELPPLDGVSIVVLIDFFTPQIGVNRGACKVVLKSEGATKIQFSVSPESGSPLEYAIVPCHIRPLLKTKFVSLRRVFRLEPPPRLPSPALQQVLKSEGATKIQFSVSPESGSPLEYAIVPCHIRPLLKTKFVSLRRVFRLEPPPRLPSPALQQVLKSEGATKIQFSVSPESGSPLESYSSSAEDKIREVRIYGNYFDMDPVNPNSHRKRNYNNACYAPSTLSHAEARRIRKRVLDQRKLALAGSSMPSQHTPTLQCGHFDPDFVKTIKGGKVRIPAYRPRPEPLLSLARFDGDVVSKTFMQNIRQYNCLFAFTSMGAHIDRSLNDGRGPPVFKPQIVNELLQMLDTHNPFAKKFRIAKKRLTEHANEEFIIRIIGAKEGDPVQYDMPTTDDLAMLVIGDFSLETFKRDIIIETRNSELKRISSLHPAYMALQYPLLFPYGERGFQVGVMYSGIQNKQPNSRIHMTMQDYYCYQFHYKPGQPNPFLSYGILSNQAKVDARACIDENRLTYILNNQDKLRIENLQGISDAVSRGCINGEEMGKTIVLPASHIGGRRYMIQNYHDSIAICRVHGPPDFFVTFTCNAKWPEIIESLYHCGQKNSDAPDIAIRIFHMKLQELLHDIKSGNIFGPCKAELDPKSTNAAIRVRIIRKWEFRGATNDGPLRHVNLILADEQSYSVIINIDFIPFPNVLGILTEIGSLHHVGYNNSNIIRDIFLKDINNTSTKVTLWGHQASSFSVDNNCDENDNKPVVVLFVGCLAKRFKGEAYLSATAACTWYFNPDIPEAQVYYSKLVNTKLQMIRPEATEQEFQASQTLNIEDKTIEELLQLDPDMFPQQGFKCTVTISRLVQDGRWWFPSCIKCNKSSS